MPHLGNLMSLEELNNTEMEFSIGHIRSFVQNVVKGLKALHSKKITHGSLKLSNIFVNLEEGQVKIADYGNQR
jgi:CTD kinase subunit alpha